MASQVTGAAEIAVHTYQALYGQASGKALQDSYVSQIGSGTGFDWANSMAAGFKALSDSAFATKVLTNLGISATTLTASTAFPVPADTYTALQLALTNYLTAAGAANRGTVVVQLSEIISNLEGDTQFGVYGTVAATYNTQSLANFTYSSNAANATPGVAALPDPTIGTTYTLTTAIDNFVGGAANDTFNGVLNGVAGASNTLSTLDALDGGAGANVLNVSDLVGSLALPGGLTVKNIATVNVQSVAASTIDITTGFTGVTALNITGSSGNDVIKAGATTNVSVVDVLAAATVGVTGGLNQTVTGAGAVTVSKAAGAVNITAAGLVTADDGTTQTVTTSGGVALGGTTGASGAITVVDKAQGAVNSTIDGGTSVSLTTTTKGAGTIAIGGITAPTAAVTVVENLTSSKADLTGGKIGVTGGSTVSVTVNASQTGGTAAKTTTTGGAITVTGTSDTTTVTVAQTAAVAPVQGVTAVAGVTETGSVAFGQLTAGETIILGGLTFTSTGATTAAQAAAAFANLADGAMQGASAKGTYSGALTGWSTGALSTSTVVFTNSTASSNVGDLANTGTSVAAQTVTVVDGSGATKAVTAVGGIADAVVTIADANAASATKAATITSVTLSNYDNSTISSSALSTLSLTGAVGTLGLTSSLTTQTTTTLDLTVNALSGANTITDTSNHFKTINVHTTGADSKIANIVDSAATKLTVDGTKALVLTSVAGLSKLATVTVSGSVGLTADVSGVGTVTDVNASATSGANVVTVLATQTTYEGGTGADNVTITAAPTKAIGGGDGADTLTINVAAATFSDPSTNTFLSGFETLGLGAAATGSYTATGFSHLTEGAVFGPVTYTNVAAGVDLAITAAPTAATTYTLKDATGTSDALSIAITGAIAANTVNAAGIESVSISSTKAGASITLVDAAAKTITVTGAGGLALTSGNTAVTLVDASGLTGALSYTTAGTLAETVKGGAGANSLVAAVGTIADTLIGGAGADTLTANAGLDTLTGGAGADVFKVMTVGANVNTYSTITDAASGDTIMLKDQGTEVFTTAKVVLSGTAVFQDYANAVVNAGGNSAANAHIGWFQFSGDTYVVESLHNTGVTADFVNNTDLVVKLTGLVDLSTASLNSGVGPTLLIA